MEAEGKAKRIALLTFSTPQMRAFHMTWIAFFLCFFAWFGIAPLMAIVREEMQLTKEQIGWTEIDLHLAAAAWFAAGDGNRPGL